jgi:hypothetical protein
MTDQERRQSAPPFPSGQTLPGPASPLSVEASARLVSGWATVERRLYEVVGSWVTTAGDPAAKIYFDTASQHHAWRERLWEERLPGLPAHLVPSCDRTACDRSTSPLEALGAVEGDVERLSGYCRAVLPRIVVGYRSWQSRCSGSSDRPVARALGFALMDVLADWESGSSLLTGYLCGDAGEQAALAAASASSNVDRALARHGLLPG